MSIVVFGVNHRTGPLALLERVALAPADLPKAITGLVSLPNVREAVVLSTCNRTEVYAVAERFHGAYAEIRDFFCDLGALHPDELHPHLYTQHDDAAVAHLFEVAAGLDSAVLGETEILGQVRAAWELAQAEGGARATLNLLFRHALETGKRARTETAISRGTASVSSAAVEMATERLGSLDGKRVLVLGAGEMGEGVAHALVKAGAADIIVTNRTHERGAALAERVHGRMVPYDERVCALAQTDVLVTCSGAGNVVDASLVAQARGSIDRPLLVVDIAVPRNVDASVADIPGVTLLDLEDLRDWAARGVEQRTHETEHVRSIVHDEVERFGIEHTARQAAPLVAMLHERAEKLRTAELERFAGKLASLDPAQRAAVEAVTKGLVAKLLHQPSVRLKDDAGTPQGERNAAAVRDLFDLT
ncbi:MAG: glutamyl-tRNA reductase [Actinomycetes bacterium]|jgi:glutamyl-tRNA reductase|uniref:glutamyl-tRNA reductase n=1 Tax=freshwater metagenome TaxID=449393 RepID=A0A6J6E9F7_9ZZZZ|nr:glutamyl-tRNA reductase [Actinomycetota bacterium]